MRSWLVLCALVACGDSGGVSGPPCEQLAHRLCDEARACANGSNECGWMYMDGTSGGTHSRNCSVCERLTERTCDDPTKTAAQIDACADVLDTATCGLDGDEPVVILPPECAPVIRCNEGPCTQ